ncbi:MAG: pilus assembly protein PilM [Clostridia bacterium]|nr:pilus assembly protein PilM [Clostridia bacterium]
MKGWWRPGQREHPGRWQERGCQWGCDVGSRWIKLVQAKRVGQEAVHILNAALLPVPEGAVENGVVRQPERVAEVLGTWFREQGVRRPRVVSALSGQLSRVARYPRMSRRELMRVLALDAQAHVPAGGEDAVTDFAPLDAPLWPEERGDLHVLVVAAARRSLTALRDALAACGCALRAIEVDHLAQFRAFDALGLLPGGEGTYLLLDFGASAVHLSVYHRRVPLLHRTIPVGADRFLQALEVELGATRDEADRQLRRWGVREDGPLGQVLLPLLDRVLDEIGRTVQFFRLQSTVEPFERVLVTGGLAQAPGLVERLERSLPALLGPAGPLVLPAAGGLPARCLLLGPRLAGAEPLGLQHLAAIGMALWKG